MLLMLLLKLHDRLVLLKINVILYFFIFSYIWTLYIFKNLDYDRYYYLSYLLHVWIQPRDETDSPYHYQEEIDPRIF